MEESRDIETQLRTQPPRRRRPSGRAPAGDVSKREAGEVVAETSAALLRDAGYTMESLEFKDLQLITMVDMGIQQTTAAKILGQSAMWGTRIAKKLRTSARFRQRVDAFRERLRQNYVNATVAALPVISQIEQKALAQYQADPMLAVERPRLLKDLRTVAGVQADVVVQQGSVSNIMIDQLQLLIQGDVRPDGEKDA